MAEAKFAVAAILAALLCTSAPAKAAPDEIRVAINSDILSTNPGVLRDGNTDTVLYHVVEALVAYREDLSVGPLLAESVELLEDGRLYRFRLRAGLRFHNGAPVTAREVKWSWDRMLDPATGFRCREFYDGRGANALKIEAIEIFDERTVQFRLNQPSALFLDRMANVQCQTAILHPDSVAADRSWREPVGTGPYRVREWRRGESILLERFADYVARDEPMDGLTGAKIAAVDKLRFVVAPDRMSAKASLYAGQIDLVFAMPLNAVAELAQRERNRGDVHIHRADTLDWTVLLLQSNDKLLADPRMRRAIAHAVSSDLVAEISTFGLARGNSSAVQRSSRFHTAVHDGWPKFDPDEARRLAIEAGYRGDVLTIQANRRFAYMFDNAVAIQALLTAAGFNVRIEVFDWATQLSNFFAGKFQLSSFGYSARSHPALLYGNFTGDKKLRATFQWSDPVAMELLQQVERAGDDATMQSLLDQLHTRMREQVPLIGLYNDPVVDLTRATLHGYRSWALGRPRLWGVTKD
ncbi:ABC transporter substrate-binding protein [Roseiterribacter gracilis]|uniref:Peptide ABC transporter substrate-binding protein n=1 Tax=Roseiterribacter gracilis TaxID=2812848 RepID=A0A8S8XBX2_9PROT|nr:peptide ABC transporter substrate-binding protein [Rhodospirillales bacterium TMPK1]